MQRMLQKNQHSMPADSLLTKKTMLTTHSYHSEVGVEGLHLSMNLI